MRKIVFGIVAALSIVLASTSDAKAQLLGARLAARAYLNNVSPYWNSGYYSPGLYSSAYVSPLYSSAYVSPYYSSGYYAPTYSSGYYYPSYSGYYDSSYYMPSVYS